MLTLSFSRLFYLDALSAIMLSFIVLMSVIVGTFARRYLRGDHRYKPFFSWYFLLATSLIMLSMANHSGLFLFTFILSNLLAIRLMTHQAAWKAARNGGKLATIYTCILGTVSLLFALMILFFLTGQTTIQAILQTINPHDVWSQLAALFILLAVLVQTASWPFYRWLLSSLNAPTPVNALVQTVLVSVGVYVLVRFAPLYVAHTWLMIGLFVLGLSTALLGTVWKLIQANTNSMLTTATLEQMGWTLALCGLGLFPAAILQFYCHGFVKAHLLLSAERNRPRTHVVNQPIPAVTSFSIALFGGLMSSYLFVCISQVDWFLLDTTLFLVIMTFITATQFSMAWLTYPSWKTCCTTWLLVLLLSGLYGLNLQFMTNLLQPMQLMIAQPLNVLHIIGLLLIMLVALLMLFKEVLSKRQLIAPIFVKLYVNALNASQAHPTTITAIRQHYRYE